MDKPRPRVTAATSQAIIIESPSLQTLQQQFASSLLTLIFWGLWLYLFMPLFSFAAWFFGVQIFYHHMIILQGYEGLFYLLKWYTLFFGGLCGSLLLWARINFFRFRNKENRKQVDYTTTNELASHFKQSVSRLAILQKCKKMTLHFSKDGLLLNGSDCED